MFSILFAIFFTYIFPLFFSYLGVWKIPYPILSLISLGLGALLWAIYNLKLYQAMISQPIRSKREYNQTRTQGRRVQATVESKLFHSESASGEQIEVRLRVPNFAQSEVPVIIPLLDTKPHLKRFEFGNTVYMRLSDNPMASVLLVPDDGEAELRIGKNYPLVLLSILYPLIVLVGQYYYFSDGQGFRFLSPWHPWVWAPLLGLLFVRIATGSKKSQRKLNELLLYGVSTLGQIDDARFTHVTINDKPQMNIFYSFEDAFGQRYHQNTKQLVAQSSLGFLHGEIELIYNPKNPNENVLLL